MKSLPRRFLLTAILALPAFAADQVKTANGVLEGTATSDSVVRMFKGVPFAQPPVGDFRWREPQPVKNWTGVRQATEFGPRCVQQNVFGDMNFRSNGMSEDCLYLNIWTPAKKAGEKLPVLVYFYGGGYVAGDGSEPRYDGESMARKGIVAVTMSYRLAIFGFMAHPELTKESPHHASGNYGLLDQAAAVRWVHDNIAAFGGDPRHITIAGESAGSTSVSAQMASPLSKDLIAGAIGESGSLLGTLTPVPLAQAEQEGVKFATKVGADSLAALRKIPAEELSKTAGKPGMGRFSVSVDGYFFPEGPLATYTAGKQAHVPLLAGWNSQEASGRQLLGKDEPTKENFEKAVRKAYGENADEVLKAYSGDDIMKTATELASDRFIAFSTWKWADLCMKTGGKPVYRYYYSRPRPPMTAAMGDATPGLAGGVVRGNGNGSAAPRPPDTGAVHSAEIEYAMGNLSTNKVFAWTPDDYAVSKVMEEYFANFIKTGNPNGHGLPKWPTLDKGEYMRIDVHTQAEPDRNREHYLTLDRLATKAAAASASPTR